MKNRFAPNNSFWIFWIIPLLLFAKIYVKLLRESSKFKCLLRACPCSMPAGSPRHPHHLLLHHLLLHLHLLPQQKIDIENPDTVIQTLTFKISKVLVVETTVVVIDNMLPIISPCHWNGQPIWRYIKHYTYYLGSKMSRMEKKCNVNNTRKRFFDIIFVSFCGFLVMNYRLSIQALNVIKKRKEKTPPRSFCKICIKVIYFSNKHDTHRPQGIESFQPMKGRWYGIETVFKDHSYELGR